MAEPSEFNPAAHYDSVKDKLDRLALEVEFTLNEALKDGAIKLHGISTRVKERDSYIEKIQRKAYDRPLEQVEDLVGARVVCLFITDLPALRAVITDVFEVLSEENKIDSGPTDSFGYMSVHYVCTLKPENKGTRYEGLAGMKFEIQCRTILMDAWANVSHYLAYKGEASIPAELRREFHALAGLFFIADKHFETLYSASTASDEAATALVTSASDEAAELIPATTSSEGPLGEIGIDRSTMNAYLQLELPNRVHSDQNDVSEFVQEVFDIGIRSLGELNSALRPNWPVAERFERAYPPTRAELEYDADQQDGWYEEEPIEFGRFETVGLARLALAFAREDYRQKYGWNDYLLKLAEGLDDDSLPES
ncbi:MAG: hypothetical protein JWP32_969 [Schumannella sp.]|nr:hypothetical protein [Schumannella sp.]